VLAYYKMCCKKLKNVVPLTPDRREQDNKEVLLCYAAYDDDIAAAIAASFEVSAVASSGNGEAYAVPCSSK